MPAEIPSDPGAERRRVPRYEAAGTILFRPVDNERGECDPIHGELIDRSEFGFRAQHASHALDSGVTVEFECADSKGCARVVWTRITGHHIESGFHILDSGRA